MAVKEKIISRNPYKPEPKKVIYYKEESSDSFTIRLDWKLEHGPGQFIFCSLPGIGEAPISICSYSDDYIELNIRVVGNVTQALSRIRVGDELLVRGPYGTSYPMEEMLKKDIYIVGGGCGVAPLKGVIEYIERYKERYGTIYLCLGFRSPKDTLFLERLKTWMDIFDVNVSYDKIDSDTCIRAREGFVTQLVENIVNNKDNAVALLCGPPIMIDKTVEILLEKGFSKSQIYLSAERLMYCGLGRCGGCMIHGKYTCLDGPVFRYDQLRGADDDY